MIDANSIRTNLHRCLSLNLIMSHILCFVPCVYLINISTKMESRKWIDTDLSYETWVLVVPSGVDMNISGHIEKGKSGFD